MRKKFNKIAISELVEKFKHNVYVPIDCQRKPDAWNNKNKQLFILSIIQDFYIPPLLFSNKQILDGLQRTNCCFEFLNDKFKIYIDTKNQNGQKVKFSDLEKELKEKILNYQLIYFDLTNDDDSTLSDNQIKELFIRINENSIKLNSAEKFFAKCNYDTRKMLDEICKNPNLMKLTQGKKGNRFSIEMILIWCLTLIHYRANYFLNQKKKSSIRNLTNHFACVDFNQQDIDEMINFSTKTIDTIYAVLGDNSIPKGKFKVIFTSIFIPFYENVESHSNFLKNKISLKTTLNSLYKEFIDNQQIGGIHYDSYWYIKESIKKVEDVLEIYIVDNNRIFSNIDKQKILTENLKKNNNEIHCSYCGKKIPANEIQYDHIKPYIYGGKTEINNGQILCETCNRKLREKNGIDMIYAVQIINNLFDFENLTRDFEQKNKNKKFSKIAYFRSLEVNHDKLLKYDELNFLKNLFTQRNYLCHPSNEKRYYPFGENTSRLTNEYFNAYNEILNKLKIYLNK